VIVFSVLTFAAPASATVMTWGENSQGQLGNGTTANKARPVTVCAIGTCAEPLEGVKAIDGGDKHTMALLENGQVVDWGENTGGQLGNGTTNQSSIPVKVCAVGTVGTCPSGPYLEGVTAIAAHGHHSLALLSNGTVVSWGDNAFGEVGDGTGTSRSVPVRVCAVGTVGTCTGGPYLEGVTAISAGGEYSLALVANGQVRAWGRNLEGELGDGTTANKNRPVAVCAIGTCAESLEGIAEVSARAGHTLALSAGGRAIGWGKNNAGQLGNGTTTNSTMPVKVCAVGTVGTCPGGPYLEGIAAISAGAEHSLALLPNGTVTAWGLNESGELGDGTTTNRSVPVKVCAVGGVAPCAELLNGVTVISAGGYQSLALRGSGPVLAWGGSQFGQLGNGTTSKSTVPVRVCAAGTVGTCPEGPYLEGAAAVCAYAYDSMALLGSQPPPAITSVKPNTGPQAGGTLVSITGTNFTGTTAVTFGMTGALSFTVNSPTSITAVAPPGTGTVDVTVTSTVATSATGVMDQFTYASPHQAGQFGSLTPLSLRSPWGVAVDSKGNVWVSDTENNRVQEFSEAGAFIRQFGSKGSGNGQLSSPRGLAVDSNGNVWVVDAGNHRIQEFSEEGTYIRQFGGLGTGQGQFLSPAGIATDSKGHVWVTDGLFLVGSDRIQEFSETGTFIRQFGSQGSGNGQLDQPQGVAIDSKGNVWVADTGNNRIEEFSEAGAFLRLVGTRGSSYGQLLLPVGVAVDSTGNVWVADTNNNRIQEFSETGEYLTQFGTKGSGEGQLSSPQGIALTTDGKEWVADTGNSRLGEWVNP
jgi:alpha-tubulin suppressor-like RCC1 family protein/sugar lactone lactonase YvrE